MATITINTAKELKGFFNSNRKSIKEINGAKIGELYPMVDITNKHASYYDVESQGNKFFYPPFKVLVK